MAGHVHVLFAIPHAKMSQQTRNVIVTFSIGFKLVTLNLTFRKRLANVYVLCQHIFLCVMKSDEVFPPVRPPS